MKLNELKELTQAKLLKIYGIEESRSIFHLLLNEFLGIDVINFHINGDKKISLDSLNLFNEKISLIEKEIPVQYVIGHVMIEGLKIFVNKSVLIPRPDTELIIEKVLKNFKKNDNKNVLDIGTGTGCIILSILLERKKFRGTGIDTSKRAINIAKINAKMQQFGNRIRFINTDIDNFFSNKYDLIVSNPPYIKKFKLRSLIEDVKNFEPKMALDGGPDGFSVVLKVIAKSSRLLKKNGMLILEIDNTQVIKTKEMLKNYKFYTKDVFKDLSDKNRCITAIKL